jgi:hypothetical protein
VIVGDYTDAGDLGRRLETALSIDQLQRDTIEKTEASALATRILERLPKNNAQRQELLLRGHRLSRNMSWQVVVRDHLLPALTRACSN